MSGNPAGHRAVLAVTALASGLLMGIAQCFEITAWLALIALVPLLLAVRSGSWLTVWLRFGLFNAVYTLITIHWIRHTGPGIVWFLPIGFLYTWAFLAIPAACTALARPGLARWLVLPPALALTEMLQRTIFFRLHWTLLGQPLADYPILAQAAALGGPEFLTLLVVAVNVTLAMLFTGRRKAGAAAFAALLVLMLGCGALRLRTPASGSRLRAGIVQPMLPQKLIWTPDNRAPLLARLNRLIDQAAASHPAVIVLPETALNGLVRLDKGLADFATAAVRRTRTPLLFGTYDYDQGRYAVAAILITTDDRVFTYRKVRLVPFIEYTPAHIPYHEPPGWIRFTPGDRTAVFPLAADARLGPLICIEDIFPDLARRLALDGASVLTVLVNTENFAGSAESLQHLRRARLTSIAVGLPMLRAANSAVSGAVDPQGRLSDTLAPETPAAVVAEIPLSGGPTLYRAIGDVPVMLVLVLLIVGPIALRGSSGGRRYRPVPMRPSTARASAI